MAGLLRLILLVVAVLAAPAAVAMPDCHAAQPATAMAGMPHHTPAPKPATAVPGERLCLGCIAPATIHPPLIAAPAAVPAIAPAARTAPIRHGLTLLPATPPPRRG